MVSFYSKNEIFRSSILRGCACVSLLVALSLLLLSPGSAQTRKFTAKSLTPVRTISAARKEIIRAAAPTRSAAGARKGAPKGQLRTTAVSAPCDVTIAPGASPAGGYLPLSGFGITPVPGVSDDSLTDFDTPAFTFAGETYSRIGFSSNGYAIIGGSTDPGDNTLINQNFPDPIVPNNVLAPFWTDLNPEAGGNLYIGVLTDGSDSWVVLDWEAVSEFSTLNQNSFEIWVGINGDANPGEDVSYAYGTMQGSGNGGFLTVGAENKFGTHGQNYYFNGAGSLPVNGTQLRVSTTSCLANRPWTALGSTGTIDEDSLASSSVSNFVLGFSPGSTGTVTARYNITPTHDLARFCPATSSHIAIRFRDEDDVGGAEQVILTVHQSNIASGGNNTIFTFDSNVSAQPLGAAFQTFSADPAIDFDFNSNIYWVEVQVIRSTATGFVNFASVQISESDGTACP
jgi:hypothetical protein